MKYHVIDSKAVIIHEPIGRGDSHRLNSAIILDQVVGSRFAADLDMVWGLVDPMWRDPRFISEWIDSELVPQALARPISPSGTL